MKAFPWMFRAVAIAALSIMTACSKPTAEQAKPKAEEAKTAQTAPELEETKSEEAELKEVKPAQEKPKAAKAKAKAVAPKPRVMLAAPKGANVAVSAYHLNEPLPEKVQALWQQTLRQIGRETKLPMLTTQSGDPIKMLLSLWAENGLPPRGQRILKNLTGLKKDCATIGANTCAFAITLKDVDNDLDYYFTTPKFFINGAAATLLNDELDHMALNMELAALLALNLDTELTKVGDWQVLAGEAHLGFRPIDGGIVGVLAVDQTAAEEMVSGASAQGAVAWALGGEGLPKGPVVRIAANKTFSILQDCMNPWDFRSMMAEMPDFANLGDLKIEISYEGSALKCTAAVDAGSVDNATQLDALITLQLQKARYMVRQEEPALAELMETIKINCEGTTCKASVTLEPWQLLALIAEAKR